MLCPGSWGSKVLVGLRGTHATGSYLPRSQAAGRRRAAGLPEEVPSHLSLCSKPDRPCLPPPLDLSTSG